ncbi:MAG: hypothetical protein EBU35_12335 [Marivivens sp.]|nr:hypothetical protein [Marivivens sp.]
MKLADSHIDAQEGALLAQDAIAEWLDRYRLELDSETEQVKIRTLEDGCVRIQVGEGPGAFVGTVSSHHLVEPKINQLQQYWLKAQAAHGNHS